MRFKPLPPIKGHRVSEKGKTEMLEIIRRALDRATEPEDREIIIRCAKEVAEWETQEEPAIVRIGDEVWLAGFGRNGYTRLK
jgi:hypothetical protein